MSDLIVFDYETLGTLETSVVLSMGMVAFKESWVDEFLDDFSTEKSKELFLRMVKEGLYLKFDVTEQVKKYKRTIDAHTLTWWASQGETAKLVLSPHESDVSISTMESSIKTWYGMRPKKHFYTRGMIDSRWYQNICDVSLGMIEAGVDERHKAIPWFNCRDVRTAVDELLQQEDRGYLPKELRGLMDFKDCVVKHNALHDAASDALNVVIARIKCFVSSDAITEDDIPF